MENTGSSRAGAFDVEISDTLPNGFLIPTGGLNLQVTDGVGDSIDFIGLGDPDGIGSDLFGNGIQLDDSNAPKYPDKKKWTIFGAASKRLRPPLQLLFGLSD
ncbi:MAG: hypothetical protein QNJ41_07745 [Xenococcaceae cyanobacterium MO_188.B32]|nr:hypothetical protein [Xenococcaceae cyanobacterium MO_188.B32]